MSALLEFDLSLAVPLLVTNEVGFGVGTLSLVSALLEFDLSLAVPLLVTNVVGFGVKALSLVSALLEFDLSLAVPLLFTNEVGFGVGALSLVSALLEFDLSVAVPLLVTNEDGFTVFLSSPSSNVTVDLVICLLAILLTPSLGCDIALIHNFLNFKISSSPLSIPSTLKLVVVVDS